MLNRRSGLNRQTELKRGTVGPDCAPCGGTLRTEMTRQTQLIRWHRAPSASSIQFDETYKAKIKHSNYI